MLHYDNKELINNLINIIITNKNIKLVLRKLQKSQNGVNILF